MEQTKTINSGRQLTTEHAAMLAILLQMIIPASSDGKMPAASELQIDSAIANDSDDVLAAILADMDYLTSCAQQQFARAFTELETADQQQLVAQLRSASADFMAALATATAVHYYQHDRVLTALGLALRPPAPVGNTVPAGDLSLLDPVRARAPFYRS
ncbi:MAG: hypothetical protein ACI9WS_001326 [Paraglaciecola psychrophila]|jgi:hypothetical protein